MPDTLTRAVLGFMVAAISVLTFHAAAWEAFHLFGLMPPPYPTRGVPPFGVPQIISLCVWGALFGLILPTLPTSIPMWVKGLGLGIAAALFGLFVVASLKGQPIAGGWQAAALLRSFAINGCWGLGVGLMLPLVLRSRRTLPA
ncbi:MAG: hypothetical protein ACJ8AW_49100 [Rhodopila sp.]